MNRLIFAPAALIDFKEIHDYIANDDPLAALKMLDRIKKRCEDIAVMPGSGQKRDYLQVGLRSATEGDYIVFYRVIQDGIEVVHILHGKRNIPRIVRRFE